ncbi:DUF6189 family protein [Phytomonospora sp. NPDC050363]|uniref:DUF6189 family protein n=1 Tax=Phytomonospora sp. NPDC050363 TaxID=3155642 RepID=UPI0033C06831
MTDELGSAMTRGMSDREYMDLTDAVVGRLTPVLASQAGMAPYADIVRLSAKAGEWQEALTTLVNMLAKEGVAIGDADRADLVRLFTFERTSASAEVSSQGERSLTALSRIPAA